MQAIRNISIVMMLMLLCMPQSVRAEKIGALVTILGAEPIHVEGIGVVTGLAGTGDKSAAARKALKIYLDKSQLAVDLKDLESQSVALVRIDAEIPAFKRPGQKIPVRVTAIGDAQSLAGGVLLMSPLSVTPDGEAYVWASGRIIIGGGTANTTHPTSGTIPANKEGGGQVVKVMTADIVEADHTFRLNLNRFSLADTAAIARRINDDDALNPGRGEQIGFTESEKGTKIAWAVPGQVIVRIPDSKLDQQVEFISRVLELNVAVERPARVLINHQTNTVVITGEVRVDPVAISHNNLTVTLSPSASALPGSPQRKYTLDDKTERKLIELDGYGQAPNLRSLINTLNAMRTSTRDIIVIMEKLKNAGALHGELIVE